MIRNDRLEKSCGGIISYIHESVKFVQFYPVIKLANTLEFQCFEIVKFGVKPIFVIVIYNPSVKEYAVFLVALREILVSLLSPNEVVLLGDFNIDALKKISASFKLFNLTKQFNLWQVVRGPTRVTESSQSQIDHIYVSSKENWADAGNIPFLSDHNLTYVCYKKSKIRLGGKVIFTRKYVNLKPEKFNNCIHGIDCQFLSDPFLINSGIRFFELKVLNVLDMFCPVKKKLAKLRKANWFSSQLVSMRSSVRQIRSKAERTNSVEEWLEYRKLKNRFTLECRKSKKDYFQTKFSTKLDTDSTWTFLNELTNFRKKPINQIVKLRDCNMLVSKHEEMCKTLIKDFTVKHNKYM